MARRIIDISTPLQNDVEVDPPIMRPRINYIDHKQSVGQILPFFPGPEGEDLPDGQGWAVERFSFRPTTAPISMRRGIIIRR